RTVARSKNPIGHHSYFTCQMELPLVITICAVGIRLHNGVFGGRVQVRDEAIEQLGLKRLLHQSLGTLSKGQPKRVLLAIGLMTPHPVLLADEPFDGLDLRQTCEVASMLRAHAAKGRTLFLSIHQISDAARVCDRFVLLSAGRVCGEGTLEQVSTLVAART